MNREKQNWKKLFALIYTEQALSLMFLGIVVSIGGVLPSNLFIGFVGVSFFIGFIATFFSIQYMAYIQRYVEQ